MNIQTINIHVGNPGPSLGLLAALFSQPDRNDAPSSHQGPPAIGEYWKEQGGVYVGMGRGRDGGKDYHLILATDTRAIFSKRCLDTYGIDVPNASSDHDGPSNTAALAAAGSDLCKEILALDIDGHRDFYLMSRTDAQLCWANVPELFEKVWHLTSTQSSAGYAWGQRFAYGFTYGTSKKFEASARVCRRLFL